MQDMWVFQIIARLPVGIHCHIPEHIKLALFTGVLSQSQYAASIGRMGGEVHICHPKRGGELTQVIQQAGSLVGWNPFRKRPATDWGLWVQLKATPIDINLKLVV